MRNCIVPELLLVEVLLVVVKFGLVFWVAFGVGLVLAVGVGVGAEVGVGVTVGSYTFNIFKDGYEQMNQTIRFNGQAVNMTLALSSKSSAPSSNNAIIIAIIIIVVVMAILVIALTILKRRGVSGIQIIR